MNETIGTDEAVLNITYASANGDLPNAIPYDAKDEDVKSFAKEAIQSGSVPGIDAQDADFADFMVQRFPAKDDLPNRVVLRPKTQFGMTGPALRMYQADNWLSTYRAVLTGIYAGMQNGPDDSSVKFAHKLACKAAVEMHGPPPDHDDQGLKEVFIRVRNTLV